MQDTLLILQSLLLNQRLHNIMNVNFETPVQMMNALVPKMKKNWGRAVNITSCAGLENRTSYIYCL